MISPLDAWSLAALDALPLSVVIADARAEDCPVVFVNAAFRTLTGYAPEEVLGKNCRMLQGSSTDPVARASIRRAVAAGERVEATLVNYRKDGRPFRNHLVLSPLRDAEGTVTHYLGVARDVSLAEVTEARARADAERLQLLTEATHDAVWDWDLASGRVEVNARHRALFGSPPDEPWTFATWRAHVDPEQVERLEQGVAAALADPSCHAHEHLYRVRAKSGLRWVRDRSVILREASGKAYRVLGALNDVTAEHTEEEHLRGSAQRYRRLLDLAFEAVNVYDASGARIFRNATGDAIVAEHGIAEGVSNVHPEDAPGIRAKLAKLFAEPGARMDLLGRVRATSGWRSLEVRAENRLADPDVQGVVMHWRDATERLANERERHEAEARERRLRELFETVEDVTQIGGWELEVETGSLHWTPGTHHIHETTPASYAPSVDTAISFYEGAAREVITRAVAQAMKDGSTYALDLEIVTARGRRVPVRTTGRAEHRNGKVVRLYGAIQDITVEVRARAALRRQAAVIDQIRDAIVVLDLEGRVIAWNEGANRLYGQPIGAVLGRRRDLWEPGSAPVGEAFAEVALRDEQLTFDAKVRRGDATLEVRVATSPFLDETGLRVGLIALVQDITGTKRLQAQLEVAQRMESIGMLAGGVAHDFNNLLTVVQGNADDVLEDASLSPAVRAQVLEIREAATRAADLTRQLLAFSRRQVLTPVRLELSALVRNTSRLLSRLVGEHIVIREDIRTTKAWVEADRAQLEQVVLNLAINARDAMPAGGRLTVGVEVTEVAREVADLLPGEYCALVVNDSGIGMDEATQQRIFEPFFSTKDETRGTGLGLATVYGIVKQSGGAVVVESRPGLGSTFRVLLPMSPAPEVAIATGEVPKPRGGDAAATTPGETILLVEDDSSVRRVCRRVLEKQGYSILEASQPSEALEIAGARPHGIALVLTDIVMPGMSGAELVQRLRKTHPDIRYLLISGYAEDMDQLREAMEDGMTFLPKPFTPDSLARAVRAVLTGAEAR